MAILYVGIDLAKNVFAIHGVDEHGKAVLAAAKSKDDRLSRWAIALEERRGYWKAVVPIAAKNACLAWAVLAKGENFKLLEA